MQHGRAALRTHGRVAALRGSPGAELPWAVRRRAGQQHHGAGSGMRSSSRSAAGCSRASIRAWRSAAISPRWRTSPTACRSPASSSTRRADGDRCTLALLQAVRHQPGRRLGLHRQSPGALSRGAGDARAAAARTRTALYLALVRTLATRTAQLHGALAAAPRAAACPASDHRGRRRRLARAARRTAAATLKMLGERTAQLPVAAAADARTVLARRSALLRSLGGKRCCTARREDPLPRRLSSAAVLLKRNDFVITDFEAAADASVAAASERCSPLRDVASMLRSFAYARRMALQQCSLIPADERSGWEPQLDDWEQQTRRVFLPSYDEIAREGGLYASFADMQPLLRAVRARDRLRRSATRAGRPARVGRRAAAHAGRAVGLKRTPPPSWNPGKREGSWTSQSWRPAGAPAASHAVRGGDRRRRRGALRGCGHRRRSASSWCCLRRRRRAASPCRRSPAAGSHSRPTRRAPAPSIAIASTAAGRSPIRPRATIRRAYTARAR